MVTVSRVLAAASSPPPLPPDDLQDATSLIVETLTELGRGLVAKLPIIGLALVLFVVGLVVARYAGNAATRGLRRTRADHNVVTLVSRLLRIAAVIAVGLLALSITGIDVGAALAGLGIVGLALAFAMQNILENFVAGILLLVRKPFGIGEQIRTSEFEGTVEDIDLRVTRLVDYDGETVLIPNADVFTNPLINLTRRGTRRTRVMVGVDYRDDHDLAREVIRAAITQVEGVMGDPEPEVLLTELADSSVNFEVRYWTAPDIRSVRHTQDRVLSAAKSAIEEAGMTIPWPIRTLVVDDTIPVQRQ